MKYYDEWSYKYDKDMEDWNYTGPKETSKLFNKYSSDKNVKIYDAGCGTGLVGVELKKYGFSNFFGADLSQKLLDLVPKGLYTTLDKVDLNKPVNEKDSSFDAVMCVGTFTFGHVKPHALDEFINICSKIDFFHYASDKSFRGRDFVMRKISKHFNPYATVIMDDIDDNLFFKNFVEKEKLNQIFF